MALHPCSERIMSTAYVSTFQEDRGVCAIAQTGKVAKKSRKARKAKAAAAKAGAALDPEMQAKRSLKYQRAIARHEAQVQELMRKVRARLNKNHYADSKRVTKCI